MARVRRLALAARSIGWVAGFAGLLLTSPVWAKDNGPWPAPQPAVLAATAPALKVSMSVTRQQDKATYSILLRNPSDTDVRNIFVAGTIAPGTDFIDAGENASKVGFKAVEGGAAVWLTDAVPAGGWAGPFTYRVRLAGDTADPVWAWVHWLRPTDGTAISPPIRVLPAFTSATLASAAIGTLPEEPLMWRVEEVSLPPQLTAFPITIGTPRVLYHTEGLRTVTQDGESKSYGPGSAFVFKAGTPVIDANRTDAPDRWWAFAVVPERTRGAVSPIAAVTTLFESEELEDLLPGSYTLSLRLAESQPGASVPTHFHLGPKVVYVLEGSITSNLGTGSVSYGPGSIFAIQRRVLHSTNNNGPVVARYLEAWLAPEGHPVAIFPTDARLHPWATR